MNLKLILLSCFVAVGLVGSLVMIRYNQVGDQAILGIRSERNRGSGWWKKPSNTPTIDRKLTMTPVLSPTLTFKPTLTPSKILSLTPTRSPQPTIVPTSTTKPLPTQTLIPTVVPTITPTSGSSKTTLKWGAYAGWNVSDVTTFESKVGKQMDYVATFVHWGNENELPLDLGGITKSRGKTLVLYWEAMDYNVATTEDSKYNYDSILRGDWDNYINSFVQQSKNFGGQVILIPFEEMNGDWYTWSGTKNHNSASKHVAAYRYLRKFFAGVSNVKFGWTVNNESTPDVAGNQILDYYPGDDVVDFVGVNGFNFNNPWQSFAEVFNKGLTKVETINKPIIIFSMSCAQGPEKGNWIRDGLGSEIYKHPKVTGFIWFNENKEKDWRVWSSADSLDAFKSILK